jgi:hypothetical protein
VPVTTKVAHRADCNGSSEYLTSPEFAPLWMSSLVNRSVRARALQHRAHRVRRPVGLLARHHQRR